MNRLGIKILLLLFMLSVASGNVFATHNRAGEITYKQVGKTEYEVTLITYTDTRSAKADRPVITIEWGDGQSKDITRQSQITLPNFVWKNTYVDRHVYSGPGHYIISFADPNRVAGIINMEVDQSVNTQFYVESLLIIDPLQGFVQSPILLNPPIQNACLHHIFTDNPDAYDADGDSLHFILLPPQQARGIYVPGYYTPHNLKLDSITGEVTWNPVEKDQGIYNIAIKVEMYRNKKLIGYIIRDEQIIVVACDCSPPFINPLKDTCIEAGINFNYQTVIVATDTCKARDTCKGCYNGVKLTASGGPFLQTTSPAIMINNPASGRDSVKAVFEWTPSCKAIREQPYIVIFKAIAIDSSADIKSMQIN